MKSNQQKLRDTVQLMAMARGLSGNEAQMLAEAIVKRSLEWGILTVVTIPLEPGMNLFEWDPMSGTRLVSVWRTDQVLKEVAIDLAMGVILRTSDVTEIYYPVVNPGLLPPSLYLPGKYVPKELLPANK